MTEKKKQALYSAAMEQYGKEKQLRMLQEECGELIAAVNHWLRERVDDSALLTELADVEIMVEQIKNLFSDYAFKKHKQEKLARLSEMLGINKVKLRLKTWDEMAQIGIEDVSGIKLGLCWFTPGMEERCPEDRIIEAVPYTGTLEAYRWVPEPEEDLGGWAIIPEMIAEVLE